jgi:hypothetical protein
VLRLACIACLLSALLQAWPVSADLYTEEPLPIKTLLADPKPYDLHTVTLHGVVRHLKLLDPPFGSPGRGGSICRNAYTFLLDDRTASVVVGVPMNCRRQPPVIELEVIENETVFIEGQVLAPGTYIDEALAPLTKVREEVLVVVKRIWR